jgi:hypothetical protein
MPWAQHTWLVPPLVVADLSRLRVHGRCENLAGPALRPSTEGSGAYAAGWLTRALQSCSRRCCTPPVHSLIDQSLHSRLRAETTNGDGFGIGWYDAALFPGVFS